MLILTGFVFRHLAIINICLTYDCFYFKFERRFSTTLLASRVCEIWTLMPNSLKFGFASVYKQLFMFIFV